MSSLVPTLPQALPSQLPSQSVSFLCLYCGDSKPRPDPQNVPRTPREMRSGENGDKTEIFLFFEKHCLVLLKIWP